MAKTKKEWKDIDWARDCPNCGGTIEVFTEVGLPDGHVYDGDVVRCTECGCPGMANVGEGDAWITSCFEDVADCDCDWCVAHRENEE